jgi:hypothetical protein
MRVLKSPVRISLAGQWSDQACWQGPAAVVNAAVGWGTEDNPGIWGWWRYHPYPLWWDERGFHSIVPGVGTGLGISGIRHAMGYIYDEWNAACPNCPFKLSNSYGGGGYIPAAAARDGGGGWQDPIGAIEPGFKLIATEDHAHFRIQTRDNHPIFERIVLFDTKTRRNSAEIGDRMRGLLSQPSGKFRDGMEVLVEKAAEMFRCDSAERSIETCLAQWRILCGYVAGMEGPKTPLPRGAVGSMLVGAGGGGWGVMFTEAGERENVVEALRRAGYPAYVPVLLGGACWDDNPRLASMLDALATAAIEEDDRGETIDASEVAKRLGIRP